MKNCRQCGKDELYLRSLCRECYNINQNVKRHMKNMEYQPEENCISLEANKEILEILYPHYDVDIIDNYCLKNDLNDVLLTVKERERNVINMIYGLNGNPELTYEESGYYYGLTRQMIQCIKDRTLRRLRHPSRAAKLKQYLS